jgi:hypothetical protein
MRVLYDNPFSPFARNANPARRGSARKWERRADTLLDAILHDISVFMWAFWYRRMRKLDLGRGDRIEWLLARGVHDWFLDEIRAGRVAWSRT